MTGLCWNHKPVGESNFGYEILSLSLLYHVSGGAQYDYYPLRPLRQNHPARIGSTIGQL